MARVSGEPYAQYIERRMLAPLGMKSTRALPEAGMPGLAVGYGRRVPGRPRDVEPFVDLRGLAPAGSAQILKGSTLREMHRPQWIRPDWRSGQDLGFAIRRVNEQVRIGHGGSVPGHRTHIEIVPVEKLAVIVLTNANDGDPVRYVDQAFRIVGPAVAKAVEEPKPALTPDPAWEKHVGTYTWKHSDVHVMILNGELTLVVPDAENPWESRVKLTPVGTHTFRMTGGASSGELLRFDVDAAGNVMRMTAGNYYRLRKPRAP